MAASVACTSGESCQRAASSNYNRGSEDPAKVATNVWLAKTTAAILVGGGHVGGLGSCESPWALILETESLLTFRTLQKFPLGDSHESIVAERTVIPNPDTAVCGLIKSQEPKVHAFQATSHQLLDDLVGGTGEALQTLKDSEFGGVFSFVWLDYCGTFDSKPGKRRQKDIEHLISGGLLAQESVLAITFSTRGSPELYEYESADRVVHFVETVAASSAAMTVHLVGVCTYSADTQQLLSKHKSKAASPAAPALGVFTIVFHCSGGGLFPSGTSSASAASSSTVRSSSSSTAFLPSYPEPLPTPGLRHHHADEWRTSSTRSGKKAPLLNALERVAADFSSWVSRFSKRGDGALVLDSRLAVNSKALLQSDSSTFVTVLLPDAANRGLVLSVLQSECRNKKFYNVVDSGISLHSIIGSLDERGSTLGSVFLDYGNNKPFTASALRRCSEWFDLKKLFESGLLGFNKESHLCQGDVAEASNQSSKVVAILVNVAEADDSWVHLSVDWIVHGFKEAAQRYIPNAIVSVCQVTSFVSPVARVAVVFRLGNDEFVVDPGGDCQSADPVEVASWFTSMGWSLDHPKTTTAQHRKKFEGISKRVAVILSRFNSEVVFVSEPGFLIVVPEIITSCSTLKTISLLTDHLSEVEKEHSRYVAATHSMCEARSISSAFQSHSPDALLLLSDGSAVTWRRFWMESVEPWLIEPCVSRQRILIFLCESIDRGALLQLIQDLKDCSKVAWDECDHDERPYVACSRKLTLVTFVFTKGGAEVCEFSSKLKVPRANERTIDRKGAAADTIKQPGEVEELKKKRYKW